MGRPQSGQAEEVTSGASGRAGCSAHAEVGPDERVYAGDGGRGVVGKWAVSQKAVHLASTCRGGVIQKEGSPRWRGKAVSQPHTVGRAEVRSEGGSDVETWAACRRSLRRHKLPTPHLALWPTEVHVVMRGKVCEKGCYFLGTQIPLVAACKSKVCISNICHYLHFWKHTDFQNKDIQSPKYSVVLHLDHCIPVWGGGGCLFFSPLCSRLITEPPYTPQMWEPQTYLSLKHTKNYHKSMYLYFLF